MEKTKKPKRPANLNSMRVHRVLALLYVGIAVVFGLILIGLENAHPAGVLVVSGILAAIGALHAGIALGASRSANWARVLSIVVGCVLLIGFPIGTLIGGYLLVNSKWPEGSNA